MLEQIVSLLGSEAEALLRHECRTIPKERLHLPGPDFLERVHADSDRNARVKRSLSAIFNHGRLAGAVGRQVIIRIRRERRAGGKFHALIDRQQREIAGSGKAPVVEYRGQ